MNQPNNTLAERIGAITRSIASGNNACGTLIDRQTGQLNTDFIAEAVRPTLQVYEDETRQLAADRDAALRQVEAKRFALECIASNLGGAVQVSDPAIMDAIRRALPGMAI